MALIGAVLVAVSVRWHPLSWQRVVAAGAAGVAGYALVLLVAAAVDDPGDWPRAVGFTLAVMFMPLMNGSIAALCAFGWGWRVVAVSRRAADRLTAR